MLCIKKNILLRISCLLLLCGFVTNNVIAQLVLTNGTPSVTINFSNSMQTTVGTNASTAFTGAGFDLNPTTAGRLNSAAWQINGWSDGVLNFNGTRTTAATDFTRGAVNTAQTTGGIYAYTGAPGSVANPALMVQPGGSDFAPGDITLRVYNGGTTIITQLIVSYNLFVRNDQPRANSFNFSWSTDNSTYTDVLGLDYTSTAASDLLGWVQVGTSPSRTTTITGISITPGSYIYIRWSSNDVSGSGSRDEFGLDDITCSATYTAPCTPPATQASAISFSSVVATQMQVNFTRGNGTGGIIIVASTSATLSSTPVSGNVYAADPNFGNGDGLGGGFVVFNGVANGTLAAANFLMTGLAGSTTYYLYAFEYDAGTPCYLAPAVTGSQLTPPGAGTSPTDYFESRVSGNWSTASTWRSSPDNATWIVATVKPTLSARSIIIRSTHTVTITGSETAKMLDINAGGILTYTNAAAGGYSLDIAADPAGVDFKISGTYRLYGIQPGLATGATAEVYNGGIVEVNGNVGGGSDNFAQSTQVSFFTGAIFDWRTITAFQTNTIVYFPNASPTDIATFRISANVGSVGSNSTTLIQGLLEVNSPITFINTGTKTFRNGIIGTALLTQGSSGALQITGATARLGGTGVISLFTSGGLSIAPSSVTTLISNKTINSSGSAFTVDGTLLCAANIVNGASTFTLSAAGTLGIGSVDGITTLASGAVGNIQTTVARNYNTAANYLYNSSVANQVTGNGLPSTLITGGSITVSNTAAAGSNTVTLTTNLTTTPTLNLANGLFEAGTSQFLRIAAAGTVNSVAPGGHQGQSAAAGTIWFTGTGTVVPLTGLQLTNVRISGAVVMGGGNTRINGTLEIASSGWVNGASAPTYSSTPASTLLYTCGCNYGIGQEWYANTYGAAAGVPHHVTLAAGTSLDFQTHNTPHEMRGDITINNGSTLSLSTNFGGDLYIKGHWTRTSTGNFVPNTRAVKFNGSSGTQVITRTGGGTETFQYMIIDKSAGQAVQLAAAPNATNVSVTGAGGGNTLQLVSGDLDLNQQTLNFSNYLSAQNNLGIDGTAGNLTRNVISTGGTGFFAVSNSDAVTHAVTINRITANASLLVFGSSVTLSTTGVGPGGGGLNFGNTLTTVNGTLRIDGYGYVTGFAPTYGTNSFLVYNSAGTFDRNVEWGTTSGPGYPYHVIVQNGTNIRLNTPAINGDADRAMAGNLTIVNGSSLLLSTTAPNRLTVAGNVFIDGTLTLPTVLLGDLYIGGNFTRSATGVFNINDRAVFFYGSGNSTITANGGQLFPYLYLAKNAQANTLTLLDDISISKKMGISTGTFDPATKNATLKSDASGTASFGQVGASGDVTYSAAGRFIVERYIPTGVLAGQHKKSWQFLAVPDNGGQTINAGWQEGYTLPTIGVSNLGTIITNNVAGAGFDIIAGVGPSMKTWNPLTATWVGVANTASLPLYNQKGYFLFVRGDRNVSAYNQPATTTTLRSKGRLFVPVSNPAPSTTVLSGRFESIGNPYASTIDFRNLTRPAAPAIDSTFYVWDPLLTGSYGLGGFQTISSVTGYKPTPGGTANYDNSVAYPYIQSGQAFMVHATGAGGTISFTESVKVDGSSTLFRLNNTDNNFIQHRSLRTELYTMAGDIADANVLVYDQRYNNDYESNDALKILNAGENLGIKSNGQVLSVEARKQIVRTDTIHYITGNLLTQTYQFRFLPENMDNNNLRAFLEDRYLHTRKEISLDDSSHVNFTINTDPASSNPERFILVFLKKRIQHHFPWAGLKEESGKEAQATVSPGSETGKPVISVYPNPVAGKMIQLNFKNNPPGNYQLQLMGSNGQLVHEQSISVKGSSFNKSIYVPGATAGLYRLTITAADGTKTVLAVVVE